MKNLKILKTMIVGVTLMMGLSNCQNKETPARLVPMKDFFKNPEKSSFSISPDGNYLAFLSPWKNRMNIYVQKIGSSDTLRVTSVTDRDIAGFGWKGQKLIYGKDFGGDENFHIFSVNANGSDEKDLTPFPGVKAMVVDHMEDFDDVMLVQLNKNNPMFFDVYRLTLSTGELVEVAKNPGNITGWVTDHDGKIRIAVTTDGINTSLLYRETEKNPFKTIITTTFKESCSPLFFTFDNKQLYCASNLGRDKLAIVKIDPNTGKELEVLFENPDFDVSDLRYSHKRKVLTRIVWEEDKNQQKFLDPETEQLFTRLTSLLPGYEVVISSMSKDEDKLLVRTYTDRSLGAYYFYDKKADSLTRLHDVSPWISEDEMCEMKPIQFQSRDGLTIHGYLTLPRGVEAKNLPVVINPHGGPWYRDSWGYNPEIQFLANRGYAVLQMNFRGSTGYGKKFWEASFKKWGREMQNDISDGVKWLVDQGIADGKRIAIYGGSYGGYATLAGITLTPELYACAVDYVGVSNLFTFMKSFPPYWKPYLEMMYEMVGNPETDSIMMAEVSPVFLADKIQCPLFIAQGANDPRVNKNESDQMVEALKKRGIAVEYMVKDNEGHGFHNEENQFDFYGTMEKFLAKHIGGRCEQ